MDEKMENIIELKIKGMTCDSCAIHVKNALASVEGVKEVKINGWKSAKAEVKLNKNINTDDLVKAVKKSGYGAEIQKEFFESPTFENSSLNNDYNLIIIGGGSAAFAAAIKASELNKKTLMINSGLPIGGTCVNVGCVPSKNLIRVAESIYKASQSPFKGIKLGKPEISFNEIIKGKKTLVKNLRTKKYIDVIKDIEGIKLIEGKAKFFDSKTVIVNDKDKFTADKFFIATGSSPVVPPIEGINNINYYTNDSLFELEELPESLLIIGGGYIGLEIAQAYSRFGSKVTVIEYFDRILFNQTQDVSDEILRHLKEEGINIHTGIKINKVSKVKDEIILTCQNNKDEISFTGTHLLLAAGRQPNTTGLALEKVKVETIKSGHIKVNDFLQTTNPDIFAIGDCNPNPPFVYTAAYEGKTAALNAFEEKKVRVDYTGMPWVIFTDPQVAGVGIDENEAKKNNIPYEVTSLPVAEIPRALAAKDTRGFIKLIRNPETDLLLGARIIAPEGGELAMEISLAIKYNITTKELSEMMHPYLTLSEGIKLASITFGKDVSKLSCCAS
jgi:mercuric reductase